MFERIVRHGILTTVILLIVCVLGLVAAARIPVQMIPDLDVRTVSVRTVWPGATPQDIEKEILIEQEDYLRELPTLSRMISDARSGTGEIQLEFPFGTDMTEILIRVNNALSQVPSYPEAVDEPVIYASSFSSNAFMFMSIRPLPGNPRGVDLQLLKDFVDDNVAIRLARVPGVSEIGVNGASERQVQVLIDPARLAQRQLGIGDIRNAIRERNRDRSAGDIDSGKRQYLVRTIGRFKTLEDLSSLIVARRGASIIYLRDVADVRLSHFEQNSDGLFNGEPSIQLRVLREPGSNVIAIRDGILAELDAINRDVLGPAGLSIEHVADDAHYVEESIANVWTNLALGTVLAILVMYAFVRSARTTLIGVMGIPVCIIIAFLGMLIMGRTINVISLAGIAFAIGMTLDNSIVVMESIQLQRARGLDRVAAAVEGVRSVWTAVLASTLTTVLVFLPVTFIEQESGQLYGDVAIAISAAIIASMMVAITALPVASARLTPKHQTNAVHRAPWGSVALLAFLDGLLGHARRRTVALLGGFALGALIILLLTPDAEYLPEGEEPKIFARLTPPPGTNQSTMSALMRQIYTDLEGAIQADPADWHAGNASFPAIKYTNMFASTSGMLVVTEPMDKADIADIMDAFAERFERIPGMRQFVARGSIISSNDGGTRSINLDISGGDLGDVFTVARRAYERARDVFDHPRIQSSPGALTFDQPMLELRPDWTRAAELGLSATELGYTVAALTDGAFADEFILGDDKIDIYLYSSAGQNARIDTLAQLPIHTPNAQVQPLGAVLDIRERLDTDSIRRVNGNRTVTLNIIPPADIALEHGVDMVREQIIAQMRNAGEIPNQISVDISGAADQLDATRDALTTYYPVALLIIYLLLAAIFNHWGYPLLIMTTIPLGIAGGIFGLWLLNLVGAALPALGLQAISQPFDMISMLGFLILMGTVVNNPILIVDRSIQNRREGGMSPVAAVRDAVATRLRPIAMSTITTLAGLAPLVLVPGAGVELYRGVGVIVMFGIIGAALVSVTLLPALTVLTLELLSGVQSDPKRP